MNLPPSTSQYPLREPLLLPYQTAERITAAENLLVARVIPSSVRALVRTNPMLPQYCVILSSKVGFYVEPKPDPDVLLSEVAKTWAKTNKEHPFSRQILIDMARRDTPVTSVPVVADIEEVEPADEDAAPPIPSSLELNRNISATAVYREVRSVTYRETSSSIPRDIIEEAINERVDDFDEVMDVISDKLCDHFDPQSSGEETDSQSVDSELTEGVEINGLRTTPVIQAVRDFVRTYYPDHYTELTAGE